ncbi:lacticin RM [Listeria newyorkensis]|uniref:lacticin RM n=1 Tax=Listeria newyorkensis TaxID=1497681 RepID=UPI001C898233|nr:lacticin RM [Listeria newyorkensis]
MLSQKRVKMIALAFSCTIAFTMVAPALNVNAEESLNDLESLTTAQAISEIDNVGIEEVTGEEPQNTKMLLKAAAYKNKTYSYKRGGFAAWCKDYINYKYNGTTVAENNKWQEAGYIFPNMIGKKGITNYANGAGYKDYRGTKTYKIGTPSPWGDVAFAQFDRSDYYRVKSNGTGYLK